MEIMEGSLCEHVCACKRVCACVHCQQLDGCQLLKAERLNLLGETRRALNHRHNPTQLELLDRRRPPVLTHSTHINTSVSQKHASHSNGIVESEADYWFLYVLMGRLHAALCTSAFCSGAFGHWSFLCYHKRPSISVMEVNRMFLAHVCPLTVHGCVCLCMDWACVREKS